MCSIFSFYFIILRYVKRISLEIYIQIHFIQFLQFSHKTVPICDCDLIEILAKTPTDNVQLAHVFKNPCVWQAFCIQYVHKSKNSVFVLL